MCLLKTVVISDLHLGYAGFNASQFELFLKYLDEEKSETSRLLILGDLFDLWRAYGLDSVSFGWPYIERIRSLEMDIYYIIGNHDYHMNPVVDWARSVLSMKILYPGQVFDDSLFVVHGDYFDIYELRNLIPDGVIFAIYESIYHCEKPIVKALEQCFYDPVMLLWKWIQLYKKKPELAKTKPIAKYVRTFTNLDDKREMRNFERGLRYLVRNQAVGVELLVPSSSRPMLRAELARALKKPMTERSKTLLRKMDTASPKRTLLTRRSPLALAREISGRNDISKVIFGHTHNAENKASQGWWNTGSWVDGESTFIEIENGDVHLFRFKDGIKTELTERR